MKKLALLLTLVIILLLLPACSFLGQDEKAWAQSTASFGATAAQQQENYNMRFNGVAAGRTHE